MTTSLYNAVSQGAKVINNTIDLIGRNLYPVSSEIPIYQIPRMSKPTPNLENLPSIISFNSVQDFIKNINDQIPINNNDNVKTILDKWIHKVLTEDNNRHIPNLDEILFVYGQGCFHTEDKQFISVINIPSAIPQELLEIWLNDELNYNLKIQSLPASFITFTNFNPTTNQIKIGPIGPSLNLSATYQKLNQVKNPTSGGIFVRWRYATTKI